MMTRRCQLAVWEEDRGLKRKGRLVLVECPVLYRFVVTQRLELDNEVEVEYLIDEYCTLPFHDLGWRSAAS